MNVQRIYIYTYDEQHCTHQNFQCFCLILMDSNLGALVDDWYCVFVLFCAEQFVLLANGNTTHWNYCYFVYMFMYVQTSAFLIADLEIKMLLVSYILLDNNIQNWWDDQAVTKLPTIQL